MEIILGQILDELSELKAAISRIEEKIKSALVLQQSDVKYDKYQLRSEFTFDSWIISPNNELAYRGAVEFAKNWSKNMKLFYLYGEAGLGKTHLLQSIGNYILNDNAKMKVSYMSIEDFTNELINSIRYDNSVNFEKMLMENEVLIFDNLQLINGKERTQEEFWRLVNKMLMRDKKIAIASNESPNDILIMKKRFTSLFEISGVYKLIAPDINTRIEILKRKVFGENMLVSEQVVNAIAQNVSSNVRELINMGIRVVNYARLAGREIDADLAMEAMKDII